MRKFILSTVLAILGTAAFSAAPALACHNGHAALHKHHHARLHHKAA
jgi:hypothetical protein